MNCKEALISLVLAASVALPVSAGTQDGHLDTGFGVNGTFAFDFDIFVAGSDDIPQAVAVQPDGKAVIAGTAAGITTGTREMAYVRILPSGVLDPDFRNGGADFVQFHDIVGYSTAFVGGVAIQPDGGIVIAGGLDIDILNLNGYLALFRLLANGTLDPSFGAGGRVVLDFSTPVRINDLVLQSDGKILVAGSIFGFASVNKWDMFVTRLNTNGSIDIGFGLLGVVAAQGPTTPQDAHLRSIVVRPNGTIVAGGNSAPVSLDADFLFMELSSNGAVITIAQSYYDLGGSFCDYVEDLVLEPAGTLLAAVTVCDVGGTRGAIVRFDPTSGQAVPSYGAGQGYPDGIGYMTPVSPTLSPHGVAVALQGNGKALLLVNQPTFSCSVVRRNPDGGPDPSWYTEPTVKFAGDPSNCFAMAFQSGQPLVVGYRDTLSDSEFGAVSLRIDPLIFSDGFE